MTDQNSQPRNETPTSPSVDGETLKLANRLDDILCGKDGMILIRGSDRDSIVAALRALSRSEAPTERNWIEDAPHENGNYECLCVECGQSFIGHKRRVLCKLCSNLLRPRSEAPVAWQPGEREAVARAIFGEGWKSCANLGPYVQGVANELAESRELISMLDEDTVEHQRDLIEQTREKPPRLASPSVDGETMEALLAFRHGDTKHLTQEHARIIYAALSRSEAPVAWRWKPKGAQLWIYNPEAGWLADQDKSTIDVEPLYAVTSPALDPATVEALRPFAALAEMAHVDHRDSRPFIFALDTAVAQRLTIGDLRRAKRALTGKDGA